MRLLLIHQNFPGQFAPHVAAWKGRPGWDVRGLGHESAPGVAGFSQLTRYKLARAGRPNQHPYLRQMEMATLHGQAAARAMLRLRASGFTPDAILAHPGWGETLYARDVFPNARLVHFCEWYYSAEGADLGFDPEFPITFDDRARIRTWNALHALNLEHCDAGVSPTKWQKSRHPEIFQRKIEVCHEGIDLAAINAGGLGELLTPSGVTLRPGDPIVTFVARNLEPYRGFHIFMRALERMQKAHSQLHAVIIGADGVSYGRRPKDFPNWRERMLSEVKIDPARTHFLGRVPRDVYARALRVTAAHVYLTYPFVLSWSLLEAMAIGAPIVASDTAPVREALTNGVTARLTSFFDVAALADSVLGAVEEKQVSGTMAARARESAKAWGRSRGIAAYERLIRSVAGQSTLMNADIAAT